MRTAVIKRKTCAGKKCDRCGEEIENSQIICTPCKEELIRNIQQR